MKASNKDVTERYFEERMQKMTQDFMELSRQYVLDSEVVSWYKGVWIVLDSVAVEFEMGKVRLNRIFERMRKNLPGFYEDKEADVLEEMLIRDLENVGLNIRETCHEYFETKERLKKYEKFIEVEKCKSEARAKEKELLKNINTNLFKKGVGKYV